MESDDYEDFLRLYTKHQRQIWRFVRTLLPHEEDADDVLQETSLALWSKWHAYDKQRSFTSWAFGVARLQTLKYRRQQRAGRLTLNESALEAVADAAYKRLVNAESLVGRRDAIEACVQSLDTPGQEMIRDRYSRGLSVKVIAENREMPLQTVYSALAKLRQRLSECVQRRLAAAEHCQP